MNRLLHSVIIFFSVFTFSGAFSQTTYTWANPAGGGDWNQSANWNPNTGSPGVGDNIIITPSAAIVITNVPAIALNDVTINGNTVTDTVILSSLTTTTLTFNGSVTVNNGGFSAGGNLKLIFNSCSSYHHQMDGGAIPTAEWKNNSNCNITGIVSTQPRNMYQEFYNFLWDCPNQAGVIFFKGNFPKGINGTCEFRRIGTSTQVNWDMKDGTTWAGDLIISANKNLMLTSTSGNVPITFTIRDLYINTNYGSLSRLVMSNMGNTQSYFTFNIRNLTVTGGAFDFNGIWSNNTNVNLRGNLTMTGGSIGNSNNLTAGTSNLNFAGTTQQDINITGGSITGRANAGDPTRTFVINANTNSIVNFVTPLSCGTGNYVNFNAAAGSTLMIPDQTGITTSGNAGSVRNPNLRNFNTAASYIYTGATSQTTGNALPAAVSKLTINNPFGITLTNALTINTELSLLNGRLMLGAKNCTLSSSGELTGTPSAGNMIVTDGLGQFIRGLSAGAASLFFPVGDAAFSFSPVTLNFTLNSSPGTVGVKLTGSADPNINSPSAPAAYLSHYWTFTSTGLSTYTYTGEFSYPPASVTGSESIMKLSRWTGTSWFEDAGSSASESVLRETGTLNQTTAPLNGNFTGRTQTTSACSAPALSATANATAGSINVCTGTAVTLQANPSGGTGCSGTYEYAWANGMAYWNGSAFASSTQVFNNTYSALTYNAVSGYSFTVVAKCTDNVACISSSGVTVNVPPTVTPSVIISASQTTVASGTPVTFSAVVTNGGSTPIYQWKKNGTVVGSNSPVYTGSSFNDQDIITCAIVSNALCLTTSGASSNSVTLTVISGAAGTVSISASQTEICAGVSVIFSATPVNGGTAPFFQWKKNGINVGDNSKSYTDNTLTSQDEITCVMTVTGNCSALSEAVSNSITVTVNSFVTPTVIISASQTTVCAGTEITFSATPTNGGSAPVYQWKVNGMGVGGNTPGYSSNALLDNDTVSCEVTSNAQCLSSPVAVSNEIVITIRSISHAGNITAARDTVCEGSAAELTVTGVSGAIQWQSSVTQSNFTDITGATNSIYISVASQSAYYRVNSTTGNCSAVSDTLLLTVAPSPVAAFDFVVTGLQVDFSSAGSVGAVQFKWDFDDGTPLGTAANPAHSFSFPGSYKVCLTVYNGSNCSYTVCKNLQIDYPTGTQAEMKNRSVTVYPNPVKDYLMIDSGYRIKEMEMKDVLGRNVSIKCNTEGKMIYLNCLPAGFYLLKILTEGSEDIFPVIKI